MNKALVILNTYELRQKLYSHCVIGFDSIKPKEDTDNLKWLVVPEPDPNLIDSVLMYHSIDDRVLGYYDPDAFLVIESEEEFFNKLKEYYNV